VNLDFGILWIEDSFSNEEEESLKRRVREAGFIARIDVIPNSIGIEDRARNHAFYHCYDIILLDYHLKDENGDELAPRIRFLFPSITILFYSGSVKEEGLRQLIAAKQVDGVYCSLRDNQRFIQRTGELIEQTARALDRLSGMRGLAMRVVAECDELMKAAVLSMCNRDASCADKSNELDLDVVKFLEEMMEKYKAAIEGDLAGRLNTRAVDSAKLFKHFRRLTQVATKYPQTFGLDESKVERLRELRSSSAQYDQKVLIKRNILGHVIEVKGENGWVLQGSNEISVTDFPDLRRVFAAHIDAIREIKEIVVFLDA
jgi:CheY-like chemotaxis protein